MGVLHAEKIAGVVLLSVCTMALPASLLKGWGMKEGGSSEEGGGRREEGEGRMEEGGGRSGVHSSTWNGRQRPSMNGQDWR